MRHAVRHLKKSDPVLAAIIERVGPCRLTFRDPTFENLVRSIAFQQLHGSAARAIFNRLVEAAGGTLTPQSILALTEAQMRAAGLSKQKLSYIRDLAERTHRGEIDFLRLPEMSDQDVIAHLTRVKGIGVWSAQMFLIFALRRPNVMPTADYGINSAIRRAYRKRKMPKPKHVLKLAEPWHPYRSIACWYLWRYVEMKDRDRPRK
ncbi:MAG TPA: DNA-3-methyladenine glycosylase [Terriglobales bacterium]|nr:DNA-3-methyladenine glycosylase [Terriglobales bacterium]